MARPAERPPADPAALSLQRGKTRDTTFTAEPAETAEKTGADSTGVAKRRGKARSAET
jgi:hypothetical protein